jgi:glutamate dehydrogenase/leucine dehydrogenase
MGAAIASHFSALGAQLAALSDPLLNGTWVFDRPPDELLLRALAQRQLAELSQLLPVAGRLASANIAHVLELDVDVLFPAATEDVITSANADRVRARYVVEGANNPTTDEAHRVLFERGVHLVPDVIANAGGIIAAFVEMTTPSTAQIVAARSKVEQAKQMAATRIADNTERLIRMVRRLDIRPDEAGDYMALHALRFGVSDETPSTGADLHDRT